MVVASSSGRREGKRELGQRERTTPTHTQVGKSTAVYAHVCLEYNVVQQLKEVLPTLPGPAGAVVCLHPELRLPAELVLRGLQLGESESVWVNFAGR